MSEPVSLPWLRSELAAIREDLFSFRRDLHQHPELSGQETRTAEKVRSFLSRCGIPFRPVHGTGTLGWIEGARPGPVILLRADIDALPVTEESRYPYPSLHPGCAHACGHDVHTAALAGAARLLSAHRGSIRGTVRLVFQQAEEFGHGSQYFLSEEDVLGNAERIYGFHVTPDAPLGSVVVTPGANAASCDHLLIRLSGKSAHIAKPQLARDALKAAADVVLSLSSLHEELHSEENVLIGIGRITAGSTWNIIPASAEIEGTLRTFSPRVREVLIQRVRTAAETAAARYGVSADVDIRVHNPCLINDDDACRSMLPAALAAVEGIGTVLHTPVPLGYAGDDFAAYAEKVPGCMAHVGTAVDGEADTSLSLHSGSYYIHDEAVLTGCELLVRCALQPV